MNIYTIVTEVTGFNPLYPRGYKRIGPSFTNKNDAEIAFTLAKYDHEREDAISYVTNDVTPNGDVYNSIKEYNDVVNKAHEELMELLKPNTIIKL